MATRRLVLTLAAFLGLALSPPLAAQSLYKSTMPDGRVRYGDAPAPGAAKGWSSCSNSSAAVP